MGSLKSRGGSAAGSENSGASEKAVLVPQRKVVRTVLAGGITQWEADYPQQHRGMSMDLGGSWGMVWRVPLITATACMGPIMVETVWIPSSTEGWFLIMAAASGRMVTTGSCLSTTKPKGMVFRS